MTLRPLTVGRLLALLVLFVAAGAGIVAGRSWFRLAAQDQAPTRRDFTIAAKDFRFSPDRIEVARDELVRLTVRSDDVAYSFNLDEYRVSRRVPAGGSVTIEFRADREGTFPFYSNLTSDARHAQTRGQIVVRGR
jgi:heme/copper-type cytochrome/quinol oxidase subunit 2